MVLLDTGAGISDVVLFSVSLASEVLIVATPEPTSLTDAYAAIKVLAMQQQRQHVRMVINQAARPGDGRAITSQLQQVLDRFVSTQSGRPVRLIHMGDTPADPSVRDAVMRRQLLLVNAPGCPAALAISQLANKIESSAADPHGIILAVLTCRAGLRAPRPALWAASAFDNRPPVSAEPASQLAYPHPAVTSVLNISCYNSCRCLTQPSCVNGSTRKRWLQA